jgi:bifunctional DNase/RNase
VRTNVPIFVEESVLEQAAVTLPSEEDERLEVYRDFVNKLFEQGHGMEEGERRPDA